MPIVRPFRSRSERIRGSIAMNELSGCGTTAATATTGSLLGRGEEELLLVGDGEVARPTPTSLSGAVGSEGARIVTSRPACAKRPVLARVVEADVVGVRRPVERQRHLLCPPANAVGREARVRDAATRRG